METARKTYLVTGAAGFIGSHWAAFLENQGYQVLCVDALSHFEHRGRSSFAWKVDREAFWKTERARYQQEPLTAIFHLGAITNTQEQDWKKLEEWNVEYSQFLFQEAIHRGIPLIYASSAATYAGWKHPRSDSPFEDDETALLEYHPSNLYARSKHQFDLWSQAEQASWSPGEAQKRKIIGFKFFNVYGPGEEHKGPMASVVFHAYRQILQTGQAKLFRSHRPEYLDGEQKRDFIFVGDILRVLEFARQGKLPGGIYNLGSGKARTFRDLVAAVFRELKQPEKIEWVETPNSIRPFYQYYTEAAMSKLWKHTPFVEWCQKQSEPLPVFSPQNHTLSTSLEEGVSKTVRWLKENLT